MTLRQNIHPKEHASRRIDSISLQFTAKPVVMLLSACLLTSRLFAQTPAAGPLPAPPAGQDYPAQDYFAKPWKNEGPSKNIYLAEPAAQGAPVKAVRARVVDFGHDFGTWLESPHFRGNPQNPKGAEFLETPTEVDENSATSDTLQYLPFSETRPFSTWNTNYDDEHPSANFYGGISFYFANRKTGGITEHFINPDHCAWGHFPRDNWALHMFAFKKNAPWKGSAVWFWRKEDFLNGGARYRVSLDESSVIHMREARYWNGYTGVRMVLREGKDWFVSEKTFEGTNLYVLKPLETKWAPYNPQMPHPVVFNEADAKFEARKFEDVTAAGFYVFKSDLTPDVGAFKFYAFELDAVVHRPERPSETLAMAKVEDFYISKTEIPYSIWRTIYKWANNNNYAQFDRPGFLFEKSGSIGNMQTGVARAYSPDEPVTGIPVHDAAAWCNALSEFEAKTPAYYTDAACTQVFRFTRMSNQWKEPTNFPPLFVKWDADGYRLPTPAEWLAALGKDEKDAVAGLKPGTGTQPVGLGTANANGLFDMPGNVRELVWDSDSLDPASKGHILLMGGSYLSPDDPMKHSASPWGDVISHEQGFFDAGFRIVRRAAGGQRPSLDPPPADSPLIWSAQVGKSRQGTGEAPPKGILSMAGIPQGSFDSDEKGSPLKITITPFLMGKTEVSYAEWLKVRQWAEANGYVFNNDGHMGNMEWKSNPASRTPDEPVTSVSHRDAMAWCNALSEIEGLTPVYYADENFKEIYKTANRYRPMMVDEWDEDEKGPNKGKARSDRKNLGGAYIRWGADGYRLPTAAEQGYASAGGESRPSGKEILDHPGIWHYTNAGGKTQPVGKKEANAFGLHDLFGNVKEWLGTQAPVYSDYTSINPVQDPQPCSDSGGTGGMPAAGGSVHHAHHGLFEWKANPGGHGVNADLAYPDIGFRVSRHPRQLEIEANGKRYQLVGVPPEQVLLLTGKKVVVDGEIEGDTIKVKTIKEAGK